MGRHKDSVLFLLPEFQESGEEAQACAKRAPGSWPSKQWAHHRVTGSLARRTMRGNSHLAPPSAEPQAASRTRRRLQNKGSKQDLGRRSQLKVVLSSGDLLNQLQRGFCFLFQSRPWAWEGKPHLEALGHTGENQSPRGRRRVWALLCLLPDVSLGPAVLQFDPVPSPKNKRNTFHLWKRVGSQWRKCMKIQN